MDENEEIDMVKYPRLFSNLIYENVEEGYKVYNEELIFALNYFISTEEYEKCIKIKQQMNDKRIK